MITLSQYVLDFIENLFGLYGAVIHAISREQNNFRWLTLVANFLGDRNAVMVGQKQIDDGKTDGLFVDCQQGFRPIAGFDNLIIVVHLTSAQFPGA